MPRPWPHVARTSSHHRATKPRCCQSSRPGAGPDRGLDARGELPAVCVAVNVLNGLEQLERFGERPLERVAAHDRAKRTTGSQTSDLLEHGFGALGFATREDDDAATVERRLHDVAGAVGKRADRDVLCLVDLARSSDSAR